MRQLLSGLCALALLALAAGCTDSNQNRVIGGNPSGERAPSASQPTAPSDGAASTAPSGAAPAGSEMPQPRAAAPSGSR